MSLNQTSAGMKSSSPRQSAPRPPVPADDAGATPRSPPHERTERSDRRSGIE